MTRAIDSVTIRDGVLLWERPKKRMTSEEWRGISFEDGPAGGYMPNMSPDDERRWKAKLSGTTTGFPQVEIRKRAGEALILIVVNMGAGYAMKGRTPKHDPSKIRRYDEDRIPRHLELAALETTGGVNVQMSMNGSAFLTFDNMRDMHAAIEEARVVLEQFETVPGTRRIHHVVVRRGSDHAAVAERLSALPGVRVHLVHEPDNVIIISVADSVAGTLTSVEGVEKAIHERDARIAVRKRYFGRGLDEGGVF
jgi:hypothetical protein